MNYKRSNIHNLIATIGKVLSLLLHTFVDVIKVFLWPIKQLLKDDRYLTNKSVLNDIKHIKSELSELTPNFIRLKEQINDPLGGIKNIQDEHSRYIMKSSKNQIRCLEDNVDMLLKKTEGWENVMYGPDVDTMIKEALNPIKEQIKALEEAVKELKLKHIGITDVRELEEKVDKLDENRRFQWQLNKDQIEVLNERTQPLIKHNVKSNLVFQLPDDDEIFEQTAKEEYDYHQESKYWDKRAKQAYEDHMSEPDEEDNSLIW